MRLLFALMCVLTVTTLRVQARLGETLEECDSRYGQRKLDGFARDARPEERGYVEYVKDGIVVSLHFTSSWNPKHAVVAEVTYQKKDVHGYFSDEEVEALLGANKGSAEVPTEGKSWEMAQIKSGRTQEKKDYVRFDGKARARVFLKHVGSGSLAQKITIYSHVDEDLKEKVGAKGGEKLDAIRQGF